MIRVRVATVSIAQLVEHKAENFGAVGSNPSWNSVIMGGEVSNTYPFN